MHESSEERSSRSQFWPRRDALEEDFVVMGRLAALTARIFPIRVVFVFDCTLRHIIVLVVGLKNVFVFMRSMVDTACLDLVFEGRGFLLGRYSTWTRGEGWLYRLALHRVFKRAIVFTRRTAEKENGGLPVIFRLCG